MLSIPCFFLVQETSKFIFLKRVGKKKIIFICYKKKNSGFFGPDAIRPFDPQEVENDLNAKKYKTKDLEMAIRQALNPSLLTELEEEEEGEEEEEQKEESEEPVVEKKESTASKKLKGKKKPTPEPKKKVAATTNGKPTTPAKKGKENATATKRRSRNLQKLEDEDEKMVDDTAVSENVDSRKKRVSTLQTLCVCV